MGDRATILVYSRENYEPPACGIYIHWDGSRVPDLLSKAVEYMRRDNVSYSTARLIGCLHNEIEGNMGLGIIDVPENIMGWLENEVTQAIEDWGPGNAGVIFYDCSSGEVRYIGGYLADQKGLAKNIGIPPG